MTTPDPQEHAATDPNPSQSLPLGWVETRLDDLAIDVTYGYTASSITIPLGPHMLRITDIQDDRVDWNSVPYCEISDQDKEKYLLQPGDLVFARTGATVGKSFLIRGEIPETVYASYLIRVRAAEPSITSFLSHFFKSPAYWNQIMEFSAGIGQPNVNGTKLKELRLPLPPLPEQVRIADKLDTLLARVEAARERQERVPKLLKTFRQSVLSAAVSGELTREWRGGGEAEWEETTLGLCGSVSGGLTKNAKRHNLPLKRPYLRVANVQTNRLDLEEVAEIGLTDAEWQKTRLQKNDLLIVEGNGSLEHLGRVSIWGAEVENCCHQNHLIRWRAKSAEPRFVLYALLSPQGRDDIIEIASTTTGLHTLSISKVAALAIFLPSLPEQAEIVRRVEALFAIADRLEQRYAQALQSFDSLTPALLQKAFRGELVPQDPSDEPASVLLERIRAQRAASGETPRRGRGAGGGAGKVGRPRKEASQPGAGGEGKRRGRPPKVQAGSAAIPEAASMEDAIAQLEARKRARAAQAEQDRAQGTRLVGLFED